MTTPALKLDPHNANRGTDRGRRAVADSLAECGAGRSILVDRDGTVIAGNKTLEAAQALGLPVRVVESSGDELVVVKRTDLELDGEDQRARRLAYLDNRAAQLGLDWDTDQILADLEAGVDLSGLWDDTELDELLQRVAGSDGLTDPDDVPEVPEEATTQPGDLWLLGEHRVLCGDATDPANAFLLMNGGQAHICWTDPPWNVAYGQSGTNPRRKMRSIANDNLGAEFPAFAANFCSIIADALRPGALLYMAMSPQEWPTIDGALRTAGFHWSSTIIWVKDHAVLARKDYHTRYEPLWYGWREGAARLVPLADRRQNDVWDIARPTRSEEHPTMKPVELVARALLNSSRSRDLVLDPFLGSGTTLIAAEQTGRVCYGMEIDPVYVDVIVRRWEEFTGKKAVLDGNEGHTQSS